MVRKTNDIALLLGSRGRGRSRSGLSRFVRGLWDSWFARSQWRDERPRSLQVPGWLAAGALLIAFAAGFLIGGQMGSKTPADAAGLQARRGTTADWIDNYDGRALTRTGFVVAHYLGVAEADARKRATELTHFLVEKGLGKARPYLATGTKGPLWTVTVWYEGDTEQRATRDKLVGLPEDVPDASFQFLRKSGKEEWPKPREFR